MLPSPAATASEGGTSRSTTVGMPASRAMSRAACTASTGSWEISVVRAALRRTKSACSATWAAVVVAVAPGAM